MSGYTLYQPFPNLVNLLFFWVLMFSLLVFDSCLMVL